MELKNAHQNKKLSEIDNKFTILSPGTKLADLRRVPPPPQLQ